MSDFISWNFVCASLRARRPEVLRRHQTSVALSHDLLNSEGGASRDYGSNLEIASYFDRSIFMSKHVFGN